MVKKKASRTKYTITGSKINVNNKVYPFKARRSRITNKKTVRMRTINGVKRPCYVYQYHGKEIVRVVEDLRVGRIIQQSGYVKYSAREPTMEKTLDHNLIQGLKEVAKSDNEQSIALDFERNTWQPQRTVIMEGGKTQTLRIKDFEMFGHTHPNEIEPTPSTADLRSMKLLEPEFIVAGKTGKIYIMNIENKAKWEIWKARYYRQRPSAHPIPKDRFEKRIQEKPYKDHISKWRYSDFTETELGRQLFYEETGIRLIPYKNPTTIEMKDDPHYEKEMPTVPASYLRKWQGKRSIKTK